MTSNSSLMALESREAPSRLTHQWEANKHLYQQTVEKIRQFDPEYVYIIGRGTSDHAGVYAKYLIEVEMGIPVCSSAPSVASVFGQTLDLKRALVIIISQSGRSPDIIQQARNAKKSGAMCIALVNDKTSPLAELVDVFIPVLAGSEKAVAATKSYICTLYAIVSLVAYWQSNDSLLEDLYRLPDIMSSVINSPPQLSLDVLQSIRHCVVLGRGFGYAISREIALKIKEVCCVQAEAFSSAEFLHGPISLLNKSLTVIDIRIFDESYPSHAEQLTEVTARGANICVLAFPDVDISPRLQPLLVMQKFYLDIEKIALSLGLDPDSPKGLNKVTQTV